MRYDPDRHHRSSLRLQGYNYSQQGAYFVTVCVHNRECLLGEISNGTVVLSEVGQAVEQAWQNIAERFPFVILDEYVLMPNHLHGILFFTEPDKQSDVGALLAAPSASSGPLSVAPDKKPGAASSAPTGFVETPNRETPKATLGKVLRAFKSLSAIQANRLLDRAEQPFWQRNYYERIIRDEQEMEQTRGYIRHNPLQWATDTENPDTGTTL